MRIKFIALLLSLSLSLPLLAHGPDLLVTNLKISRVKGESLSLRVVVTVKNAGDADVKKPFEVGLFYRREEGEDWVMLKEWKCQGLSRGMERGFSEILRLERAGLLLFKAVADVNNEVEEAEEENNFYERRFEVKRERERIYTYPEVMELRVTASRLEIPLKENPAATSVVGKDVIESMPRSIAADEVLLLVPGVKVENQADGERVHLYIRGQGILSERGIRGIRVLLDGIPLNDPAGFAPDLYDVDWATVEKIEVLRGPAASLYGGSAAGGVINIETEDGSDEPARVKGLFSLGSYAFEKGLLNVGGTRGNLNYRISVSKAQGQGYREHTEFRATNIYSKFHWRPSRSVNITGIFAWTDFYNDNAEGLNLQWLRENRRMANPDALTFNEYQMTKRATAGVVGRVKLAENQQFRFTAYYRHSYYEEAVPSSVEHRFYDTPGLTLQYRINSGKGWFKNHLIAGADLQWQSIDEHRHPNLGHANEGTEFLSSQSVFQRNFGIYLIDRVELGSQWGLVLSIRRDDIHNELADHLKAGGVDLSGKASFKENTARLGVSWNPMPGFGLYANWGTGFLPPSIEELANNPDSFGGFNPHLKPSVSHGEEIGTRGYIGDVLFYDISIFHLRTENDFGRYRVPSRPLETFYRNVGSTRRYGLETFLALYPSKNLRIQMAYTYSDFKYVSFETEQEHISGTYLPNSPKHRFVGDLQYNLGAWMLGVTLEAQSRSYVDATNESWADGYVILNARLGINLGKSMSLMIYGKNLLNAEYIAFTEPDPDGNSYHPAPTREVFASLRFAF